MSSHLGWLNYFLTFLLIFALVFMFILIFLLSRKNITKRQFYRIVMWAGVDFVIIGIALIAGNILDGVPLSDLNTNIGGLEAIISGLAIIIISILALTGCREKGEKEKLKEIEFVKNESMKMPREVYHFVFKIDGKAVIYFLVMYFMLIYFLYLVIIVSYPFYPNFIAKYPIFILFTPVVCIFLAGIMALSYARAGGNIPHEFILYDNGWFVFWADIPDPGWIAPAKLDWILPPVKDRKELEKKLGYKINLRYAYFTSYFRSKKIKKKYWVEFRLVWVYPHKRLENCVFHGYVNGYLTEEEYKKFLEMIKYIDRKAKENVESGRIKIPRRYFREKPCVSCKFPRDWNNEVFKEEKIYVLYKKETGEDIPEPIRSFLFDYKKFKKVYLKNKKKTGNWLGRIEKKN